MTAHNLPLNQVQRPNLSSKDEVMKLPGLHFQHPSIVVITSQGHTATAVDPRDNRGLQ